MHLDSPQIPAHLADVSVTGIEVRCHYGSQVLEVAEIWQQDGKLILSVFAVPTEDLKDKTLP